MNANVYKEFETLGFVEFTDWFHNMGRPKVNKGESEVTSCLKAHLNSGLTQVAFSIGRSVVEYHSKNKKVTRFMSMADISKVRELINGEGYIKTLEELNKECFLRSAVDFCHNNSMTIFAHLCMNRHYGSNNYGGAFTSELARREEMQEVNKDNTIDPTRLCFALDDYREERHAIINEVLEIGVDGICLDFCRQPPMLKYHPALTEPYKKERGIDPREINLDDTPCGKGIEDVFMDWCRYRAGVLTSFMRDVYRNIKKMEVVINRRISLIVRIPDDGFVANMIAGIDIETWCKEHLIDCVVTHPLQWIHGIWIHDVLPYVNLGRLTGIKVMGGVNTYKVERGWQFNPVCIAKRIKEQYDAGVAGISLYETNDAVLRPELSDILKSLHDYDQLCSLLNDKKWTDKWPINGFNANCGMDNHSGFSRNLLLDL